MRYMNLHFTYLLTHRYGATATAQNTAKIFLKLYKNNSPHPGHLTKKMQKTNGKRAYKE